MKTFRWYYIGLFFIFSCLYGIQAASVAPLYVTDKDKEIYEQYVKTMDSKGKLPWDNLLIETALYFLNTPYVASTLEKDPEGLVVNLREMDCTTFAENVLALARTVRNGEPSFEHFCRNLQQIRYREGTISDYTDRLHYMTDWLYVNEQKGIVKDINKETGGKVYPLHLSFISTHPDSYKPLQSDPERVKRMADKEKEINSRSYYYIPEKDIPALSSQLKNGDIVCFTTSIEGLDVTHVGIVYKQEGTTTFIHASSSAKKVIINPDSISTYVEKIKTNTGIIVARPL